MISGKMSESNNLSGTITSKRTLNGSISSNKGITGKISVSVRHVPYNETSNMSGGTTVYIAKEVMDDGL